MLMNVGFEKEGVQEDCKGFGVSYWKAGLFLLWVWEDGQGQSWGG